jgi:hypothetical protein
VFKRTSQDLKTGSILGPNRFSFKAFFYYAIVAGFSSHMRKPRFTGHRSGGKWLEFETKHKDMNS